MKEPSKDFIHWLEQDVSLLIVMRLEDPIDLVRTGAVSRSWRQFVISNGLLKKLCLKMFPETSSFARVILLTNTMEHLASGTDHRVEFYTLCREHRVYAKTAYQMIYLHQVRVNFS